MSALSVLDALDRQIGNNYNAAPSYEQLQEARAAVAELIEAARFTLQPGTHITSGVKLQQSRERLRAALARVGGAA